MEKKIKITQKDMDNPQAKPIDEVAEKYARSVKEDFKLDECTYGLVYRAFLTGIMYERTKKQ